MKTRSKLCPRWMWSLVRLVPRANCPTTFPVDELTHWTALQEVRPGQWEPARPLGMQGLCLRHRIRIAWFVFTGEFDAVRWIEPNTRDDRRRAPDSAQPNGA